MTTIEIQAAHDRLDAAEEAVVRSRYLSDELMAEYADAGHTYYAVLRDMDPASASRIHSEHYNQHRPEIRARVRAELARDGIIRVWQDGTWEYLTAPEAHGGSR
jgi:hypothetical protein